jgi:hypothetical protein
MLRKSRKRRKMTAKHIGRYSNVPTMAADTFAKFEKETRKRKLNLRNKPPKLTK